MCFLEGEWIVILQGFRKFILCDVQVFIRKGCFLLQEELIREVEMGPFKHEVDDGLDCRKAAYECLYTLLDSCLDQLNIFEFMDYVSRGLNDHYDIKTLCFLFIRRLVQSAAISVTQRVDQFMVEISKLLQTKVKPNAVKQEHEKTDELKRAALRAVYSLTQLPEAGKFFHASVGRFEKNISVSYEIAVMNFSGDLPSQILGLLGWLILLKKLTQTGTFIFLYLGRNDISLEISFKKN
jgi:TATA-binding protein interacting (TIP20)